MMCYYLRSRGGGCPQTLAKLVNTIVIMVAEKNLRLSYDCTIAELWYGYIL